MDNPLRRVAEGTGISYPKIAVSNDNRPFFDASKKQLRSSSGVTKDGFRK